MTDTITDSHIDEHGHHSGGIPWPQRVAPTGEIDCSVCHSLKPWARYDRRTGKGLCDDCVKAGHRLGEREG
jgi:hypothetical protein